MAKLHTIQKEVHKNIYLKALGEKFCKELGIDHLELNEKYFIINKKYKVIIRSVDQWCNTYLSFGKEKGKYVQMPISLLPIGFRILTEYYEPTFDLRGYRERSGYCLYVTYFEFFHKVITEDQLLEIFEQSQNQDTIAGNFIDWFYTGGRDFCDKYKTAKINKFYDEFREV